MKKPKNEGTTTFGLKAERQLGHAGAPCEGYYNLVEHTSKDSVRRINSPHVDDLIKRALGGLPEFGTEFEVTVTVKVVKHGTASKVKCHNPWPAHYCKHRKKK